MLKVYLLFNVLQKNYYEYKSVVKYSVKKFYVLFATSVALIFYTFLKHSIFEYIVIGTILFQLVYLIKKSKVFLKITKRVLRLFITIFFEIVLMAFFVPYFLIDLLIPFLIIFANFINKPIENIIKKSYIKKAIKKCDSVSGIKIAITGSYGKTSVKNYLGDVLREKYLVKKTPKSFNTPLGISKFINNEKLNYLDFLIYEFGARRVGDILELKRYFDYDISIVTNIGLMHIDTFESIDNIIQEKMSIVKNDEKHIAILNYENEYIRNYPLNVKKYTYGFSYGEFQARNIKLSIFGTEFDLYHNDNYIRSFSLNVLGRSAVLNVLPAIIISYLFKIDYSFIEKIKRVDNRLSLRIMDDYYILDDAYNSNILGARYALEVLETHEGKKFLITPGFVEMDLIKEELAKEYASMINDSVDNLILVRNNFTILLSKYVKDLKVNFVESFREGFDLFLRIKEVNSILLIENDLLE